MAVSKSWYVMLLFFFITLFPCGSDGITDTKEIDKSISTLLSLQDYANGYPAAIGKPYDRQELNGMSLGDLQTILTKFYDRLECGFLYSARFHWRLIRELICRIDKITVTYETLDGFSFDNETIMMIDSFVDPTPDRLNGLWTFLRYAHQMRIFFALIAKGHTLGAETLGEFTQLYYRVMFVVDTRIKLCEPHNYYNLLSEKCPHRPFADDKPSATVRMISENDLPDLKKAIQDNKQLLRRNYRENRAKTLLRPSTSEPFPYGSLLLFRDNKSLGLFVEEFLAAGSETVEDYFPDFETLNKLSSIDSVVNYHNLVFGTLKIIMLQLSLAYVNRITKSHVTSSEAETFDAKVFARFQHLMAVNGKIIVNDIGLNDVYNRFVSCNNNDKTCKADLVLDINRAIEMIKLKSTKKLPDIKLAVSSGIKSLKDVLAVGIRFIDKIQNEIGENTIKAVHKFRKIATDFAAFL